MKLEPWDFPMCICKREGTELGANYNLACDRSIAECTPGSHTGQHSCGEVSSIRTRRSLVNKPRIPVVRQTNHYWKYNVHNVVKVCYMSITPRSFSC